MVTREIAEVKVLRISGGKNETGDSCHGQLALWMNEVSKQ